MIDQLFPKHWTIFHRDETVQEQRIKRTIKNIFRLDGRMARWIHYWFNKKKPYKKIHWIDILFQ